MLILYTAATFLSATLLFLVQPMVGKLVLPVLGGTPAVWNTCMVFFQALLLAGYAYAHAVTTRLGRRAQTVIHCSGSILAILALPIALPDPLAVPAGDYPLPWLLGVLGPMAGAPFLALSANGPLLQRWFSATDHPRAANPYFLYAASNAGSLVALLAYPTIVEPSLTLPEQSRAWSWGYGLLLVLLVACAGVRIRRSSAHDSRGVEPEGLVKEPLKGATQRFGTRSANSEPVDPERAVVVTSRTRAAWVLLALAPSSLMVGATTYISTDLAPVPLLWVIPLAVYLATMIVAFSRAGPGATRVAMWLLAPAALLVVSLMLADAHRPIAWLVTAHLGLLLVAAMACHGRLSLLRPEPARLTEYYLLISVGGALGGVFNAIAAPLVFDRLLEYPISIALACGLAFAPIGAARGTSGRSPVGPAGRWLVPLGTGALLLVSGLLLLSAYGPWRPGTTILAGRTFFGAHRVVLTPSGAFYEFVHGSTEHGAQARDERLRRQPTTYYHPSGPAGDVFGLMNRDGRLRSVGVIGLGAGALAAYSEPGQEFTFYEIDPAIVRVARDGPFFTYLADARGTVRCEVGDGRLLLKRSESTRHDLLVVDAFNSDSIPVHLITVEAMRLYLDRLSERGVLLVHATNRHLALPLVLAGNADCLGLAARAKADGVATQQQAREGKFASRWVAIARRPEDLAFLDGVRGWVTLFAVPGKTKVWTDEFSNIFEVLEDAPFQ